MHEYRLVDDKADDVVLCRIHRRKGKGKEEEEERVAPVIDTQRRELMEVEAEQRRVKRRRTGGGGGDDEEEEAHQASAVDTDDGLITMTLDEVNTTLDELPSNASRQQSVDPVDVEQLSECLEVEPLAWFDGPSFRRDVSHSGLLEPAIAGFCCR
ncbi:uncharacterized protein LOC109843315 [Asparagus officinalis]|nr:uncharacterized protein LOC109843315 [Asparagus officinalis]